MEKVYRKIRFEHNIEKETIFKALDIVRQFIIDHNLILYGGMAIDFGLKLQGDKLYDDDILPDYDFYSPQSYHHAIELANILTKKIPNASIEIIGAMHLTTTRIRCNMEWVADIGYIPPNIFNEMEYMTFNNLRFIHPYYTMKDQSSALARPLDDPPFEVIFSRLDKDNERFKMLEDKYPLMDIGKKTQSKRYDLTFINDNFLYTGWSAIDYTSTYKPVSSHTPYLTLFVNTNIDKYLKHSYFSNPKYYKQFLDFPPVIITDKLFIIYIPTIRILKMNKNPISCIQACMWVFLQQILFPNSPAFKDLCTRHNIDNIKTDAINGIRYIMDNIHKYYYSLEYIYGNISENDVYKFQLENFYKSQKHLKPPNIYGPPYKDTVSWDPSKSHIFNLNGELTTHTNTF